MKNFYQKYIIKDGFKRAQYFKKRGMKIGDQCEFLSANFGTEPYLIKIGDQVKISSEVYFYTHDGGVHVLRNLGIAPNCDKVGKIIIGNNIFIGAKSIILPNVRIGNNCIIGTGSIVTKDVEDNSVVAGVPAKYICSINKYYEKNKLSIFRTKGLNRKQKEKYLLEKLK